MEKNRFITLQKTYRKLLWIELIVPVAVFIASKIKPWVPVGDVKFDRNTQLIVVVLCIAAVYAGFKFFSTSIKKIRSNPELTAFQKMDEFQSGCTKQWNLLLISSLLTVIAYALTINLAFLGLSAMILFLYGGMNPFKSKVAIQLGLSSKEVAILDGSASQDN